LAQASGASIGGSGKDAAGSQLQAEEAGAGAGAAGAGAGRCRPAQVPTPSMSPKAMQDSGGKIEEQRRGQRRGQRGPSKDTDLYP
jgi:hypothetical protein